MISFPETKPEDTKPPVDVSKLGEPPKEEPKQEEPKIETPLSEVVRNSLKNRLKGKPDPEPEPEKKEEPKPEDKKVEEPKKEEPKKKAAPKAKVEPKELPVLDPHQIAAEAARAAIDLTKRKPEPEVKFEPKKDTIEDKLPEQYREDLPVLRYMEKKFPEKYKGLADKFINGSLKIEQYRDQWEKENPGKEFNPEDEDHNPFFERNEVTWNDKDYARAMAAMEAESAAERERRKYSKEIEELKSKDLERELEPSIRRIQGSVAKGLLSELDKSFDGLVDDNGNVIRAAAEKLQEEDPIRFEIAMGEAAALSKFVKETEKLFHPSGKFGFDKNNPTHLEIYDFAMAQEANLSRLPANQQRNDEGKMFATRGEYAQMTPEQQKRFWQLEKEDLQFLRAELAKKRAKQDIDAEEARINKILERRGLVPKEVKKEEPKKKEEPVTAKEKPDGPSGATGGKISSSAEVGGDAPKDLSSILKNAMRGRS